VFLGTVQRPLLSLEVQRLVSAEDPALLGGLSSSHPQAVTGCGESERAGAQAMSTKTTTGLDQATEAVLRSPGFLAMKGLAKEIPIFIPDLRPLREDELRRFVEKRLLQGGFKQEGLRVVIHLTCWELVIPDP